MRVFEIDAFHDPRWDAFVESHPDGLVFHHSAWLATLREEYAQPLVTLAVEDAQGALRGVLPLVTTRGLPFGIGRSVVGRRLTSLPRTPLCGPLGDGQALARLVGAAVSRTPPGAQLQLKSPRTGLDALDARLAGRPWRTSYVVELPATPDELRFGSSRNHARIRWAVNKARREGVVVRDATSLDDVRRFYELYLLVMRHHTVPPRPLRLFTAMWEQLRPRGMMRLLLAERDGALLAGSIVVTLGTTAFYLFNGVRRDAFALRPNDVLQWHAIHDAAAAGVTRYDLGEVVGGAAGLADFKHKWGSVEVQLQRYYHPAPEEGGAGRGVPGSERAVALARETWQRVPPALTARVGDRVYGYL